MSAGWYLPLDASHAGARFEVRVSVRDEHLHHAFARTMPRADVALLCLKVDGVDVMTGTAKSGTGFAVRPSAARCTDRRFQGFVQSTYRTAASGAATLRSFYFGTPEVVEAKAAAGVGEDADGLELVVVSGRSGGCRLGSQNHVNSTEFSSVKVSERDLMKKGTAVSLKRDGKKIVEDHKLTAYSIVPQSKVVVPALGIKIFVRQKLWLQSRRIIDADGRPCTAAMADAIAKEMRLGGSTARTGTSPGVAPGIELARPAKRVKLERRLRDAPPVFIDLT